MLATQKDDADLEQTSRVSVGSDSFQSLMDLVKISPILSAMTSGRVQRVVFVATESMTVAPSFTAVPMSFLARI